MGRNPNIISGTRASILAICSKCCDYNRIVNSTKKRHRCIGCDTNSDIQTYKFLSEIEYVDLKQYIDKFKSFVEEAIISNEIENIIHEPVKKYHIVEIKKKLLRKCSDEIIINSLREVNRRLGHKVSVPDKELPTPITKDQFNNNFDDINLMKAALGVLYLIIKKERVKKDANKFDME